MAWKIFSNDKEKLESELEETKNIEKENDQIKKEAMITSINPNTNKALKPQAKKEEKVYVIPLGGIEEVGKNMTLIQYRDEILIIDAGLSFPDDDLLGVDFVIPDFSYLEKNKAKIKAVLITHGHEDHIGALPYLYKKINQDTPIYASKLTLALAKAKIDGISNSSNSSNYIMNEAKGRDKIKIGKYFTVEFVRVTHSIADAFAMAIHTPVGVIFHTGDFKMDLTPVDGKGVDFFKLAELGEKGVLLMMSDSTNAEVEGYTVSEKKVGDSLKLEFAKATGRIVIAAFASHIHRLQQIINVAQQEGRKIAIDGRSMIKVFDIASTLGYLKMPANILVPLKAVSSLKDEEVVILCTGTQGEPMAALSRIAKKIHKHITLKTGDTVIISATPIPGNELAVYNNINKLLKHNADVVYEKVAGIHVSGHGSQDEQKLMLNLIKPKYFIPVHGEYKMLKKHKESAIETGVEEKNIVIANNGAKVEVTKTGIKIAGKVPAGITLVDGLGVGDVGNIVLRDRQNLARDGIVIIVLTISRESGKLMAGPDIITRGFVYARESENLIRETTNKIKDELKKYEEDHITEWAVLKNAAKEIANEYLYRQTNRSPIILPIIMEI